MTGILKMAYRSLRKVYHRFQLYWSVNWTKTIYFNFKKFPFATAKKLPVFFFGKIKLQLLTGEIIINGPITKGMIGYGQRVEKQRVAKGIAEFSLEGKLVFNGPAQMGKDVFLYVGENAYCEFGYMTFLGSDVKLVCTDKIIIGDWTVVGYDSQIIDTNAHPMKNSETGVYYPLTSPIILGQCNSISNRISIMAGTKTPDYCVIASNTLCTKDYTGLGSNILIGGIPAKLLKNNYTRDWENEKPLLKTYRIINW